MSDHYCCATLLDKHDGLWEWENDEFASSIIDIQEIACIECDLYDVLEEKEKLKSLPDGCYRISVWGDVWWESNLDWESGNDEGSFIFDVDVKNMGIINTVTFQEI